MVIQETAEKLSICYATMDKTVIGDCLNPNVVEKTGKCCESPQEDGELICLIQTVHSGKMGWVVEFALVNFEDDLPAN